MKSNTIYFEKRKYSREEIAEILELDFKDKKFAQKVKIRMINLGFEEGEDFVYTRKEVTILWVPQSYEEKITYLVRLLGIDTRVNPVIFSQFLYYLTLDGYGDCNCMPWEERAIWLKENHNLDVSERTLRKWTNKLITLNIITKDATNFSWWCSSNIDGKTIRKLIETQEELDEMQKYWTRYFEVQQEAKRIADKKERGQYIFNTMWSEFHCKYYKCAEFVFCAWENNPIMREVRELIIDYMED